MLSVATLSLSVKVLMYFGSKELVLTAASLRTCAVSADKQGLGSHVLVGLANQKLNRGVEQDFSRWETSCLRQVCESSAIFWLLEKSCFLLPERAPFQKQSLHVAASAFTKQ